MENPVEDFQKTETPEEVDLKKKAEEKIANRDQKKIETDFQPSRTRGLSIHDLTSKKQAEEEEKKKEAYTSDDRNDFSEEEFMKVWNELAEQIKTERKEGSTMVYASMTSRAPSLNDDFKVEVLVDNKSQAEEMMHFRTDLHDHLRKKLSNGAIEISVTVNKDIKQRKAYTDEEKFREMVEQNPDLLKLKDQLDLDFL